MGGGLEASRPHRYGTNKKGPDRTVGALHPRHGEDMTRVLLSEQATREHEPNGYADHYRENGDCDSHRTLLSSGRPRSLLRRLDLFTHDGVRNCYAVRLGKLHAQCHSCQHVG